MTLRSARRAAREAYHRMAHLDTLGELPDHGPERCDIAALHERAPLAGLDVDPTRLDAIMAAVAPILRRDGVQEHARRYGRRTVQFTDAERSVMLKALLDYQMMLATTRTDRAASLERQAAKRVALKLDAVGS